MKIKPHYPTPPKKLTNMQVRFCQYYVLNSDITEAASKAGYEEKSAASAASRILKRADAQEYIAQLQEVEANRLNGDKIIDEISCVAFANTADYFITEEFEYEQDGYILTFTIRKTKNFEDLTAEQQRAMAGIKYSPSGVNLLMQNKMAALEKLARHYCLLDRDMPPRAPKAPEAQ